MRTTFCSAAMWPRLHGLPACLPAFPNRRRGRWQYTAPIHCIHTYSISSAAWQRPNNSLAADVHEHRPAGRSARSVNGPDKRQKLRREDGNAEALLLGWAGLIGTTVSRDEMEQANRNVA